MRRLFAAAAAALAAAALFAACGDGPDEVPTTAATQEATQTAPAGTASPGTTTIPAPTVPDRNIDAISPVHGARVAQADTRSPNPDDPSNGACATVNFDGLPEQFQWVRMFFDNEEVTVSPDILLVVSTSAQTETATGGTICYAPRAGFDVGTHTVTIGIQNPRNPSEPTRQIFEWQFEVVP
jgi:hypothetical protein